MLAVRAIRIIGWLLASLLLASTWRVCAAETSLERQRILYRDSLAALRSGNRQPLLRARPDLLDYPLYPYLELEDLRRRISSAPATEVEAFLQRYAGELPALRLRDAWLSALEKRGDWNGFLRHYDAGSADLPRRCNHALALLRTGNSAAADQAAAALWVEPRSLPANCDPVFTVWMQRGNPQPELAWQRFAAAMTAGQIPLARYLQRFLAPSARADAELFLQAADNPALATDARHWRPREARHAQILDFALTRLAARDVRAARNTLQQVLRTDGVDATRLQGAASRIANTLAATSGTEALHWIMGLDAGARGEPLSEDAVRYALRSDGWDSVLGALDLLPATLATTERWQYWAARAGSARGVQTAQASWPALAQTRSWYGFLAADHLGRPYAMQHRRDTTDQALLEAVRTLPGIARARELAYIGAGLESRREWLHTTRRLDARQQVAAAHLAAQWGWHQLAIMTLAAAQEWNALDLRFPIVHRSDFDAAARREKVDASWLYAIARQESALDPGVRSPAGALGLMQVMPATAQLTARQAGIPYRGSSDLLDPARNVLIGSSYMRMMLDRFGQNRVLAAAAYNAGPGRIGQWLQRHPTDVDYDRFVETIPFRETRQYVQNVLSFAVIYAYLENRQMPLVQAHERVIHNPYAETRH